MGIKAFSEGGTDEAIRQLEEASGLARASGLGDAAACCMMWIGMAYEAGGVGVRAAERYDRAIATARTVGFQQVESLCCIYLAGQLATNARSEDALGLLRRGLSMAEGRGELVSQRVGALQRARIDVLAVKRLRKSGETRRAELLLKRARRRFQSACRAAAGGAANSTTQSLHTEFVRRITLRDLEAVRGIRPTLRLWTDGSAFQLGDRPRTCVGRGPVIRRVLAALGAQRTQGPGVGLSVDALLLEAWPDQSPTADSGTARVKTVVRRLRQAGLGEILRTSEGTYFLDPEVPVDSVEASGG